MQALKSLAYFVLGALTSAILMCVIIYGAAQQGSAAIVRAREEGIEFGRQQYQMSVVDRPIPEGRWMPLWLQTDSQWADVPYSDGTIGTYGCGLTCAAMGIKYLTGQDVTPPMLVGYVGDSCLTERVNDMSKFCAWAAQAYPEYEIEAHKTVWTLSEALELLDEGYVVFAGMEGALGKEAYASHIVTIWAKDGDQICIRDPASATNSSKLWTKDELDAVQWGSFNAMKGGFYGKQ